MPIEQVTLEAGFIVITDSFSRRHKIAIVDVLRAADIPNLNISSLTLLTNLAQVVAVIVKTLVDNGTLNEELIDGYDLSYVVETVEDDLGAEY